MTENDPDAEPGSPDGPEGVFGNLPSTRPGSRSPRRRRTEAAKETHADEPVAEPVATEPEPEAKGPEPEPHAPGSDPSTHDSSDHEGGPRGSDPTGPPKSVEDLAWAGVAVVAQAATAGIRFTSKALEAARKSIDRP